MKDTPFNDEELVRLIEQGDTDKAIRQLFANHGGELRRVVGYEAIRLKHGRAMLLARQFMWQKSGVDEQEVEEVVEDSLFIVIEKIKTKQFRAAEGTSIRAYWKGVARGCCRNKFGKQNKKQKNTNTVDPAGMVFQNQTQPSFEAELATRDLLDYIHRLAENLGSCAQPIKMWLEGHSAQETSEALGLSRSWTSGKLVECREKLKKQIIKNPEAARFYKLIIAWTGTKT